MLQQTFEELERALADDNDACIDSAKAIVEVVCQIILQELDSLVTGSVAFSDGSRCVLAGIFNDHHLGLVLLTVEEAEDLFKGSGEAAFLIMRRDDDR